MLYNPEPEYVYRNEYATSLSRVSVTRPSAPVHAEAVGVVWPCGMASTSTSPGPAGVAADPSTTVAFQVRVAAAAGVALPSTSTIAVKTAMAARMT